MSAEIQAEEFYSRVLTGAIRSQIPFMVGGNYAFERYTGLSRATKDLDLFCKPDDVIRILRSLGDQQFHVELTDHRWLAKIIDRDFYVDLIFNSANGRIPVTDVWLENAPLDTILNQSVMLIPPEEMICSNLYIMARDCFHGHDVYKLTHALGAELDWGRIWQYMKEDWQVLYAQLILYGFVFPQDQDTIPDWLMKELRTRESDRSTTNITRSSGGILLSPFEYGLKPVSKETTL